MVGMSAQQLHHTALKVAVNLDPNYDISGIQHLYRRSEVFNGHLRCMLTLVQQPSWVYLREGERFRSEFPGTGTVWERSEGGNSSGSVRLDGDVMWVLKVVWGGQTESDDSFTLSSTFPEFKSRSVSMKLNTKCCCVSGLFLCNAETFAASKGFGLTVTHWGCKDQSISQLTGRSWYERRLYNKNVQLWQKIYCFS